MPNPSADDALSGMADTVQAQSVKLGDKQVSRASLPDQIAAHKYLSSLEARTSGRRPTLSSIDLSGAV